MNRAKKKQHYINLYGNTDKYNIMLNERYEMLIKIGKEKYGLSPEQTKEQIDFLDNLDEENEIDY